MMPRVPCRRHGNPASCALRPLLAVSLWLSVPNLVFAQASGCTLTPDIRDPSVTILKCGDDLTIRSAADTRYHLADQQGLVGDTAPKDAPKSVQLDSGALMIEFKPSEGRRNFQIRTPHAIAAVRGTTWAVEVEPDKTSTLVILGFVEVMRPDAQGGALLRAGQGSDVSPGTGPVTVKRWAKKRVDALLARFGQ
jgi:FecR-like protein